MWVYHSQIHECDLFRGSVNFELKGGGILIHGCLCYFFKKSGTHENLVLRVRSVNTHTTHHTQQGTDTTKIEPICEAPPALSASISNRAVHGKKLGHRYFRWFSASSNLYGGGNRVYSLPCQFASRRKFHIRFRVLSFANHSLEMRAPSWLTQKRQCSTT